MLLVSHLRSSYCNNTVFRPLTNIAFKHEPCCFLSSVRTLIHHKCINIWIRVNADPIFSLFSSFAFGLGWRKVRRRRSVARWTSIPNRCCEIYKNIVRNQACRVLRLATFAIRSKVTARLVSVPVKPASMLTELTDSFRVQHLCGWLVKDRDDC